MEFKDRRIAKQPMAKSFVLSLGLAAAVATLTTSPAHAILNNYVTHGDCSPARIENSRNITFNCVINDLPLTDIISSGDVDTLTRLLDDGLSPEALLSAFGVGAFENTPGRRFFTAVQADLLPDFLHKFAERINLNNVIEASGGRLALFWMAVQANRREALSALAEAGISPFAPYDSDGGYKRGRTPQHFYPFVYMLEEGALEVDDIELLEDFAALSPAFPQDEGDGYYGSAQKKYLTLQNRILGQSPDYVGREMPSWANITPLCAAASRSEQFDWCARLQEIPLTFHDTYDLKYEAQRNLLLSRRTGSFNFIIDEFRPDAVERLTSQFNLEWKVRELMRTPENLDRTLTALTGMRLPPKAREFIDDERYGGRAREQDFAARTALADGLDIPASLIRKIDDLMSRYGKPLAANALHDAIMRILPLMFKIEVTNDVAVQIVQEIYQKYDPQFDAGDVSDAILNKDSVYSQLNTASERALLQRAASLVISPLIPQLQTEIMKAKKTSDGPPMVAGNSLSADMWSAFSRGKKERLVHYLTESFDELTKDALLKEYDEDARRALLTAKNIDLEVRKIANALPIDHPRKTKAYEHLELTEAERNVLEPKFSDSEATLRLIGLLNIRDGYAFFLTQSIRKHTKELGMAAISGQGTKHFLHAYEDDCLNETTGNYDQSCWRPTTFTQDPFDRRKFQLGPFEDFYVAGDARIE